MWKIWPWKFRSRSRSHSQWSHSMANIKVYKRYNWAVFVSFHPFQYISISNFVSLKIHVKIMMYNIRIGAIWWQIPDFLFDGISNVWYISHHLRDIRKWKKIKTIYLENEGQRSRMRKTGLRPFDWKCLIPYGWFFPEF